MPSSTRFAVAVHLLAALAGRPGERICSDLLAGSASTNPVVVRRLMARLHRAGLTQSQLGAGGGATLARDPRDITLLDVYRAVEEGPLFPLPQCVPNAECDLAKRIPTVLGCATKRAEKAMESELFAITIADVVTDLDLPAAKK